jgi:hypothetical protein
MRDAISYPERQAPLACGGAILLEHLVGFGVELSQKIIITVCITIQTEHKPRELM